jgi:hypothetical protein
MPSGNPDAGPWSWDQDEADGLVGLLVLVGVTYLAADGKTVKSQAQRYGRIVTANEANGFEIACEGKWAGETMKLPPVLQTFHHAKPGRYRLRSTGEMIENPDLTTAWSVTERSNS